MFGSLATICISFIWTSGIFLCLVILDNLCNLKCFPQHGAVTRPWLGSLRARCSFKKKKIENPNQNKKPSAVYSLQFNVWPHSPESFSFGSLVLNMLPKTTQAFFFPPLKHTFHFVHPHSQASLKLLLSRCPPYVMTGPADFKSDFYITAFRWFVLFLGILCVSLFFPALVFRTDQCSRKSRPQCSSYLYFRSLTITCLLPSGAIWV